MIKTRGSNKRFQNEIRNQIKKIYAINNIKIDVLLDIINKLNLDGWTIRPISEYTDLGLNEYVITDYVNKHECINGTMEGIYDLDFLYSIAYNFKINYKSAYGRGTTARRIREAITDYATRSR
jgi:hypothetical protein